MKKIKYIFAGLLVAFTLNVFTQPGPPNPPSGHGSGDDQNPGGGAPIGSGVFILLSLGVAYGGKKLYEIGIENSKK